MRKKIWVALIVVLLLVAGAAITLVLSVLPDRENDVAALLAQADSLREAGDMDGARAALAELEKLDGPSAASRVRRAELVARDDPAAAKALMAQIDRGDLSDEGVLRAVSVLLDLKQEDEARAFLGPTETGRPLPAPLALAAGKVALFADRDMNQARLQLESVLRIDPNHIEAQQLLAVLLFQVGNTLDQSRAKSLARKLDRADRLPLSLLGGMLFSSKSPLLGEEVIYFGQRMLEHPGFESSPFNGNLEFYRVMSTRFQRANRPDLAWEMEQRRRAHPEAELNDKFSYIDAALRLDQGAIVEQELDQLEGELSADPRYLIARAAKAHLEGDNEAVMTRIRAAMELGEPGPTLANAIRYLGSIRRYGADLEVRFARELFATGGIPPSDLLIAANTLFERLDSSAAKDEMTAEVRSRLADRPELLAPWLASANRPQAAIEEALRAVERGNASVVPLLVDLLCGAGRVEEAGAIFDAHGAELEAFPRAVVGIRLEIGRQDLSAAGKIWDEAWRTAQRAENYDQMTALSKMAFAMRDYERVMRSYDPLIANGIALGKADFLALAGMELHRGGPAAARAILDQASVFYPDEDDLVNDRTYLTILLGESDYRTIETMEDLVDRHPENSFYRFTLALGYLVNQYRDEAYEAIQGIDFEADKFPSASRAIYAAVLSANGQQGMAELIRGKIVVSELLEREKETLEPFLGQL